MKILFDQGTPVPLRRHLHPRPADTAAEMGWAAQANGNLLAAAEQAGFDIPVTADRNLGHQQILAQGTGDPREPATPDPSIGLTVAAPGR
jgi:hypothetical protein